MGAVLSVLGAGEHHRNQCSRQPSMAGRPENVRYSRKVRTRMVIRRSIIAPWLTTTTAWGAREIDKNILFHRALEGNGDSIIHQIKSGRDGDNVMLYKEKHHAILEQRNENHVFDFAFLKKRKARS